MMEGYSSDDSTISQKIRGKLRNSIFESFITDLGIRSKKIKKDAETQLASIHKSLKELRVKNNELKISKQPSCRKMRCK